MKSLTHYRNKLNLLFQSVYWIFFIFLLHSPITIGNEHPERQKVPLLTLQHANTLRQHAQNLVDALDTKNYKLAQALINSNKLPPEFIIQRIILRISDINSDTDFILAILPKLEPIKNRALELASSQDKDGELVKILIENFPYEKRMQVKALSIAIDQGYPLVIEKLKKKFTYDTDYIFLQIKEATRRAQFNTIAPLFDTLIFTEDQQREILYDAVLSWTDPLVIAYSSDFHEHEFDTDEDYFKYIINFFVEHGFKISVIKKFIKKDPDLRQYNNILREIINAHQPPMQMRIKRFFSKCAQGVTRTFTKKKL